MRKSDKTKRPPVTVLLEVLLTVKDSEGGRIEDKMCKGPGECGKSLDFILNMRECQ